uniref:FYVE-type domain-containing protein n=1 Tax=Hyaloperonospora arabidopsidis (strain Emoy2) TaxID=559515 RepID=M4BVG6_HYAAE
MMTQQVQDAVLARTMQLSSDNKLDSDWRHVGTLGHLKAFKIRGVDSFSSTSSWATTLKRSSRATACTVDDRISISTCTSTSQRSIQSRTKMSTATHRTVGATIGRHNPLDPCPPLQSSRIFGRVQGNYRDIVDVHYATNSVDFVQGQKLLSPGVIDGAVLLNIRSTRDSYLGIKWLAENTFAGKRDVCFVEMTGYTTDTDGQEIGFVALASVDVPECPELTGSMKLTRVRMKRTMLVTPAEDEPKTTSEVFVMGAIEANESALVALAQYRLKMAVLSDISLVIDSQNIAKQKLAPHKNWVPDECRPSCSICSRKFHFVNRRRHHCRLCGDIVCKACYVVRAVPGIVDPVEGYSSDLVICRTKFCVRCVVSLRVMDKQLDRFSRRMSRTLNADTVNMSDGSFVSQSPASGMRDSSVTYFKRGTNAKHILDLGQLFQISASLDIDPGMDNDDEIDDINAWVRSMDLQQSSSDYEIFV